MLDAILKSGRKRPLFQPGATTAEVQIGRREIERILPHRDPMLLVDRISAVDLAQQTMRGHRRIDPADPLLRGHFPGYPVYPGALLVEMMGQVSLCLNFLLQVGRTEVREDDTPPRLRLLKVHHAVFQAEALPADELTLYAKMVESDEYTVICAAQVAKGETICALSVMEVYLLGAEEETGAGL